MLPPAHLDSPCVPLVKWPFKEPLLVKTFCVCEVISSQAKCTSDSFIIRLQITKRMNSFPFKVAVSK